MEIFKKTPEFDFMGQSRMFLTLSGVAVVASLVGIFALVPKFGIDFAGGTELQVRFKGATDPGQIRQALVEVGLPGSEVVSFGQNKAEYLIRLQAVSPITDELASSSRKAFEASFTGAKVSKFEFSQGGDKLTIRMSTAHPIAEVESALAKTGVQLASSTAMALTEEAGGEDGDDDGKKAKDESEGDETEAAAAEDTNKKCESVTCTWPYRDIQVYEVNLKGVSDRALEGLMAKPFGQGAVKMRSEWVGPKVGEQLRDAGIWSLIYSLIFIMIYVAFRFDLRFAPGGVIALIHDAILTIGFFTFARLEVTLVTVAALLTIIGYSINDTIVVYDRIRENLTKMKSQNIETVINASINQTLSRTILTSGTTLLTVSAIMIIGWNTTLRDFGIALFVGILIGTYSSVFVASPLVVWLDKLLARNKA